MTSATPIHGWSTTGSAAVGVRPWRAGSNDLDAGPAVPLRPGQGGIGLVEQLASVGGQRRTGRHAGRERRAASALRPRPASASIDAARSRRATAAAASAVCTRQEQGEFVAARPEAAVAVPQGRLDDPPERGQRLVAGGVSAAVVDGPEVVEVDEHEAERRACASGPRRPGARTPPGRRGGCRVRSARRGASRRGPARTCRAADRARPPAPGPDGGPGGPSR